MSFRAISKDLLFSRNDILDPRLGDLAKPFDPKMFLSTTAQPQQSHTVEVFGYPDDEGIRINGGRPGAAQAPDRIRKYLYRMTPNPLTQVNTHIPARLPDLNLLDHGNLDVSSMSLALRHDTAAAAVEAALDRGSRVLTFGGGHDYGFADSAGFIRFCQKNDIKNGQKQRPLILNFDAHLDVRPVDRGLSSGTSFFRMLESFPETDFAEIGVQGQCNASAHLEWALARNVRIVWHEEQMLSGLSLVELTTRRLEEWLERPRPAFLSIDIDAFSSAYAMGCSQSWATGLEPNSFFPLLHLLLKRLDVRVVSLYEVSPPLDQDDRTAKLAAQIAHRSLYSNF